MQRFVQLWQGTEPVHRANGMAALIACLAIGVLMLEFQPTPAGASFQTASVRSQRSSHRLKMLVRKPAVVPTAEISQAAAVALSPEETRRKILEDKVARLKRGEELLVSTPDYVASFTKQELVHGELLDEQTISMKVRHEPFSVYLKWLSGDVGREILYVAGEHEGNMLCRAGGWKGRLGTLHLDPEGDLAMKESRYPVNKIGMLELTRLLLGYHKVDLETNNYRHCEIRENQQIGNRDCSLYIIEYRDREVSPVYRKSLTYIDNRWNVPIGVTAYGWPADSDEAECPEWDESTLIENYSYTDIRLRPQLISADFDRQNEEYRLH